ncbi:hypothetical protein AAFC00_006866 [Neodothiora populina]
MAMFLSFTCVAADLKITRLTTREASSQGSPTKETTLSFVIDDTSPIGKASTKCEGKWAEGVAYPTGGYIPCFNSSFGWNFLDGSFQNINTFTLQIEHRYEDDAVGDYPYNVLTNFAKATVWSNQTTCVTPRRGLHKNEHTCHQKRNTTIDALIWATSAK